MIVKLEDKVKKFEAFLEEHECLEEFKANLMRDQGIRTVELIPGTDSHCLISSAFIWENCKAFGEDFWSDLNDQWHKINTKE